MNGLTVDEFARLYGHRNGWEYWFGEAVEKPASTWAHGILQQLIAELIREAGYITVPEIDLRARADWRPRPDVSCVLKMEGRYPSTLDIAVEILSDDEGRYILDKCRNYERVGIPQVFVLDPESRVIYVWNKGLSEVQDLHLGNGAVVTGDAIWREFEKRTKN